MSHIQYMDELVREYLLYRGFSATLKAFDLELKADKDKGFRVDKIVEQLLQYINTYDLTSLKELWSHLDHSMFSKLEYNFMPAVRKLENAVLKLYVVNAVMNNKLDKVLEFYNKYTAELQGQSEWKEWFILPFLKNPEDNPSFSVHFTRQWQDTLLVSLHNFLATVFQCMPQPTLASFEEDALRLKKLQDENDALKLRLSSLLDNSRCIGAGEFTSPDAPQPPEIMDDFYVIALENTVSTGDNHTKTLKNLIRNIGGGIPTSPIMGRKATQSSIQEIRTSRLKSSCSPNFEDQIVKKVIAKPKPTPTKVCATTTVSTSEQRESLVESADKKASATTKSVELCCDVISAAAPSSAAFLLLSQLEECFRVDDTFMTQQGSERLACVRNSQEDFSDHRASICHCKFNALGSSVVSSDVDGIIKLWTVTPIPKTQATFASKSSVLSVDWVTKNERYILAGNKTGIIRLYDTKDNRILWELGTESGSPLKDTKIVCICCNPAESTFICSAVNTQGEGKLLLYDIKTKKLERSLFLDTDSVMAHCCTFNHNGQLLIAGCSDGSVRIFDLRRSDCIDSWSAHDGDVLSLQVTSDYTSCYSIGKDLKISQRSLNQSGHSVWDAAVTGYCPPPSLSHGQLFTFDPSGDFVLLYGQSGGNVYEKGINSLSCILELGGHKSPVVSVDWSFAHQCATCVTASSDGKIRVSTLLAP